MNEEIEITYSPDDSFEDRVEKLMWMEKEVRETVADAACELLDACEEAEWRLENQIAH